MHLVNGEVAKIPVGLVLRNATHGDALTQVVKEHDGAYYCKKGTGEWVH